LKLKSKLNKGLLAISNKNSKFRRIQELFLKDKCSFLEKRRLLSLYQSIWGTYEWNHVLKENVDRSSKDTIDKVRIDPNLAIVKNPETPRSIRTKLNEIIQKQKAREGEDDEEKTAKFLRALTIPYSELDARERFELYETDSMLKRNLIINYQWQKMDTLWFQENYKCHPCMKKIPKDPEIESDFDKLYECLNPTQQHKPISEKSANLFRIN